jgi:hypothetical protein
MSRTIKDRPYISMAAEASRRGFTETPRWRGHGGRRDGYGSYDFKIAVPVDDDGLLMDWLHYVDQFAVDINVEWDVSNMTFIAVEDMFGDARRFADVRQVGPDGNVIGYELYHYARVWTDGHAPIIWWSYGVSAASDVFNEYPPSERALQPWASMVGERRVNIISGTVRFARTSAGGRSHDPRYAASISADIPAYLRATGRRGRRWERFAAPGRGHRSAPVADSRSTVNDRLRRAVTEFNGGDADEDWDDPAVTMDRHDDRWWID